jgi:hypothetical protein
MQIRYIQTSPYRILPRILMASLFICWQYGRGDHGRLGYGRKLTTGQPMGVDIDLPPPKTRSSRDGQWQAKYVACGGRHTLAIVVWAETTD